MVTQIATVVDDDTPVILLVGEVSKLSVALQQVLDKKNIVVKTIPLSPLLSFLKEAQKKHTHIYKIVFLQYPHQKISIPDKKIYLEIATYGYDITFLLPTLTPVQEETPTVFTPWQTVSLIQNEVALCCNDIFPEASFIFIQDLMDLIGVSSPLDFITQQVSQGRLFDPGISIYPQVIMSVLPEIIQILLRPHFPSSYLLKGDAVDSRSVLVQLKKEVRNYYQVECVVYKKQLLHLEETPFVVSKKIVTGNHNFALKEYSRSLSMTSTQIEYSFAEKPEHDHVYSQVVEDVDVFEVADETPFFKEETASEPYQTDFTETLIENEASEVLEKTKSIAPQEEVVDINKELQRIFNVSRSNTKLTRYKEIHTQTKKIHKKSTRRKVLFAGGIGSMLLGVVIISLFGLFWYTQKTLITSISEVATASLVTHGVPDATLLDLQEKTAFLQQQTVKYTSILDENMFTNADVSIALSTDLQMLSDDKKKYQDSLVSWISIFKGNDSGSVSLQPILQQAELYFARLQSLSQGVETFHYLTDLEQPPEIITTLNQEIQNIKQNIVLFSQLETTLPQLLGVPQRKTYAVLFQNDQELRPTGGFIQAVAILKFDQGSLISKEVYSSYELDKQLSGAVEPPEEIKKYLSEDRWYLRDSNWDPHFPATAARVKWFLEKSKGVTVDGVIGLNLDAFATLLEASGPIELSSYNEVISHKNLYERMEFHSEVVLVPDGTSKDYSQELLHVFLQNIDTLPAEKFTSLAQAFKLALDEKQVQISVFDSSQQLFLTQMGWDGSIITPPCPAELSSFPCRVESVGQFEANIGVNKANYYIEPSIDHTVKIDPKIVNHTRRMTYKNIAESNAWPKGAYKAYVRLYIPRDALLESVTINTRRLGIHELSQSVLNDKKVVGFLLEVPIQSTSTVEVSFSTSFDDVAPFSYVFFNQKQSGSSQTPVTTTILPHPGLHPSLIAPQAKIVSDSILFEQRTDSHSLYAVSFE